MNLRFWRKKWKLRFGFSRFSPNNLHVKSVEPVARVPIISLEREPTVMFVKEFDKKFHKHCSLYEYKKL